MPIPMEEDTPAWEPLEGRSGLSDSDGHGGDSAFSGSFQVVVNKDWQTVLESIKNYPRVVSGSQDSTPRVATFGGKGVGKSTWNRLLVREMLRASSRETVYIDIDPGRPEFSPPGVISAFVVALSKEAGHDGMVLEKLWRKKLRAIFIGTLNIAESLDIYLNGCKELSEFVKTEFPLQPVVINTAGFCNSLGTTVAVEVIKIFQPNIVVQIEINNPRQSFPILMMPDMVMLHEVPISLRDYYPHDLFSPDTVRLNHKFFSLKSVRSPVQSAHGHFDLWGQSSKVLRDQSFLSHFETSNPHPRPFCMEKLSFGCLKSDYSPQALVEIIVGRLVAFCCYENLSSPITTESDGTRRLLQILESPGSLSGRKPEFHAYGIIRNIDPARSVIYIATPLPYAFESSVNAVILASSIGMPESLEGWASLLKVGGTGSTEASYTNLLHVEGRREFVPKRTSHSSLPGSAM